MGELVKKKLITQTRKTLLSILKGSTVIGHRPISYQPSLVTNYQMHESIRTAHPVAHSRVIMHIDKRCLASSS